MRISALSKQTGVPVATIKFYLRERLLPAGTATGRNQAEYGDRHVRRLWLIRMLTSIGQLELSAVREVLGAIDEAGLPLSDLYAIVHRAAARESPAVPLDSQDSARDEVDAFLDTLGWQVATEAPARTQMYRVVTALRRLGCTSGLDFFLPYARAADQMVTQELNLLTAEKAAVDRAAAAAVAVLFDTALSALRRMARESQASVRFRPEQDPTDQR
jgi:DNA-binding transcriptional MerR regulator